MTAIYTRQAAAREYECAWGCGTPIQRGERYVRASLPPGDPEILNEGWWTIRLHSADRDACPTYVHGEPHPAAEVVERRGQLAATR